MTLKEIKELKDRIYELEGLLELAQMREEKIPELAPLIEARLSQLTSFQVVADVVAPHVAESLFADEPEMEEEEMEEEVSVTEEEAEDREESAEEEKVVDEEIADSVLYEEKEEADEPQIGSMSPVSRKPAFCLNDRFRFKRELFGNSEVEFSSAMNLLATMENYEEAEEYFLAERGWNPQDENVADFLEIIKKYLE